MRENHCSFGTAPCPRLSGHPFVPLTPRPSARDFIAVTAPTLKFRSHNLPDHYIRHRDFLGALTPFDDPEDDFLFTLVDRGFGLVAVRSVIFPDRCLRHRDFRITLDPPTGPDDAAWMNDSAFRVIDGLADEDGISLRSLNFPDRYLRHRDFQLYVEPIGSPRARADATFHRAD
jgi:hypothetical protein